MAQPPQKKRSIPPWIWPASALALLLVGGAFLDWYSSHEVDVPSGPLTPEEVQFAETGNKNPQRMAGVHIPSAKVSNGEIDGKNGHAFISAGEYHLRVVTPAAPPYSYTYTVDRKAAFTPDDMKILDLVRRLLSAKGLDPKLVPPDFIQQLRNKFANQITDTSINIQVAADDQKSIETLFTQYMTAKEPARATIAAQLLQALQSACVAAVQNQSSTFAALAQSARDMIPPDKLQAVHLAFRELNHPAAQPVHTSPKHPLQTTRPTTQPAAVS